MRPDPARSRADPRGVRRTAPRDVPHPDRVPAEHGRRAGVSPGRGWPVGRRRHFSLVSGSTSRSIYLGRWRIDLPIRDGVRPPIPSAVLARVMARAAEAAGAPAPASIGLILSDDPELATLNQAHLGKRGPTDVLSFPLLPPEA